MKHNLINQNNNSERIKYGAFWLLSQLTFKKIPLIEAKKKEAREDWLEAKEYTRM